MSPADQPARRHMHSGFDHVTIAVAQLDEAKRFFGLLGFEETAATVVSGERMSRYMGIPDWEADHVTMTLRGAATHQEVQLLRFHHPRLPTVSDEADLARLGFNHVCFAVEDLDATLAALSASGVQTRNEIMEFHDRRLVFLVGPGDVTIELAEWTPAPGE
jgi:catechol 2,3-dioxygenase-like lactoylglutathione lyase family enzyme